MRTRSSNRRRSKSNQQQQLTPVIVEVPEIPMADTPENFELKPSLLETSDDILEEFADELTHFSFTPEIDYQPFDVEADLRELEYLLNRDPTEDMVSILKDSADSTKENLFDTIDEMFTDEHALDYSSPPIWDDYNDDLSDLKTVIYDDYDDPFDSKEEKIKESKLLIDYLDDLDSSE
ncbi:hypothetical protein Tco_0919394 [Tanacetum coccineum]